MKALRGAISLFTGFACTALGLAMMLQSGLGMGPWGAFEVAVSKVSGLSVGQVIQIVSFCLVLVSWILKVAPTLVTFLNIVFIGLFMDWFLLVVPSASGVPARWCMFFLGLAIYGFGISEYLCINRGAGPRESLMLALARTFGMSIRAARVAIDVAVLALAALMGGPSGPCYASAARSKQPSAGPGGRSDLHACARRDSTVH